MAFKWKEHKAKMAACLTAMDDVEAKMVDAKSRGDEGADDLAVLQTQYDGKVAEFDALNTQADVAKAKAARVSAVDALPDGSGTAMPTVPAQATDEAAKSLAHLAVFTAYCSGKSLSGEERKLVAPQSERMREGKLAGDGAVVPARMCQAILGRSWANAMGLPWALPPDIAAAMQAAKVMLSTDAVGGGGSGAAALFTTQFIPQLQQLAYDIPNILDRVAIVPATSGSVQWPKLVQTDANEHGGVVVEWLDEGAPKPETEPVFENITISTHEVSAYTEVSETLLRRSAIGLEALLAQLFRSAVRLEIDNTIVNGTGVGQPLGIVNDASVRTVARQAAGAVGDTDLVNLKHAVKPQHRTGATFVCEDSVEQALELTRDTLGRPLFRASMANGPYDRLVGYPYDVATNCPTLGNAGDVIFGNLRVGYMLAVEAEVVVARSEHYRFRNNLVAFKVHAHVGGRAIQGRAIAYLDDATAS